METLAVFFSFGGLVAGAGLALYAFFVVHTDFRAGSKIFGYAGLVIVTCWIIGSVLLRFAE